MLAGIQPWSSSHITQTAVFHRAVLGLDHRVFAGLGHSRESTVSESLLLRESICTVDIYDFMCHILSNVMYVRLMHMPSRIIVLGVKKLLLAIRIPAPIVYPNPIHPG